MLGFIVYECLKCLHSGDGRGGGDSEDQSVLRGAGDHLRPSAPAGLSLKVATVRHVSALII